jgi:hypothetical protein
MKGGTMTPKQKKKKRAYNKKWREENKEQILAKRKKYKEKKRAYDKEYREKNKEMVFARKKKYREKNKEKIRAKKKRDYEENKEMVLARSKKYYEEHKEQVAAQSKEYRAKNREMILARCKKWREENREKLAARRKKFKEENPDYNKIRYHKNKERILTRHKKWRDSWTPEKRANIAKKQKSWKQNQSLKYPSVIYMIYCKKTKKYYIGQTSCSFKIRTDQHKSSFKRKVNDCGTGMQDDYNQYGPDAFEYSILKELDPQAPEEERLREEKNYIIKFIKEDKELYNRFN